MAKSKKNSSLQYDLRRVKIGCRYFMLVIAAALLFLWPNHGPAYAATIAEQTGGTSYETATLGALFQTFHNLSGHATNVSFMTSHPCVWSGCYNNFAMYFRVGDTATSTYPGTTLASSTITNYEDDIQRVFDLALDVDLDPAKYYALVIGDNTPPGANQRKIYGNTSDAYADGQCHTPTSDYPACSTLADFMFQITGALPATISITFPANASSTPDFDVWKVDFSVPDTPPATGILKLNYGTSSSTLNQYDTLNFIAYDNEEAPANIPKGKLLLPNTTYYAQANILNSSSTITATSTLISFQTTSGLEFFENNYYTYPTSTIATSTPIQITCDPDDPWYAFSLCKLMVWLFVPNPDTLNKFGTLADDLKTKAPIGYFYSFAQALGGFNTTSTPAFTLAGTASINDITGPLDVGLTAIIYLIFCIWVFNRIRKLEL